MFKNDKLHRALNKEHKFARQFIIAAVLVLVINANVMIFIMQKLESYPMLIGFNWHLSLPC